MDDRMVCGSIISEVADEYIRPTASAALSHVCLLRERDGDATRRKPRLGEESDCETITQCERHNQLVAA